MKSGRRRLLIPALLIALLTVVVVAAAIRRTDAQPKPQPVVPHTQVSVMRDSRITESSGLAASRAHPGIVYTVNDSGDESRIFAVDVDSGKVVGVTSVTNARWRDAEAMAVLGGDVWVADVGNNSLDRADRALYVFGEQGPGNHRVRATRYPIEFQGRAVDVEAMSIVPGRIEFYNKSWPVGYAFPLALPLKTDEPNVVRPVARTTPAFTTDASATPDGRYVLARGPVSVEVHEAATWKLVHAEVIPTLELGESITVERSGRSYLIGSEGSESPLVRIAFNPARFTGAPPAAIDPAVQLRAQHPWRTWLWAHRFQLAVAGSLGLLGLLALVLSWRRARRRRGAADPFGTM
jgi:hypothetical protein